MNPLEKSIKSSLRMNDRIGDLIAKIGTQEHPRGFVQVAYRNTLRSMETALQEENKLKAVTEVLEGLRISILTGTRDIISDGLALGVGEATRQLGYYGVDTNPPDEQLLFIELSSQSDSATDAVLSRLNSQIATTKALVITDAEDEQIVGDDNRKGVLRASDIASTVIFWTTAALWDAFSWWVNRNGGSRYKKQAIAALDDRTTETCIRVHGQIQDLKDPFVLIGTPRYADRIDFPGFHDYCRTATTLYLEEYDLGITSQLTSEASALLYKGYCNPDKSLLGAIT